MKAEETFGNKFMKMSDTLETVIVMYGMHTAVGSVLNI